MLKKGKSTDIARRKVDQENNLINEITNNKTPSRLYSSSKFQGKFQISLEVLENDEDQIKKPELAPFEKQAQGLNKFLMNLPEPSYKTHSISNNISNVLSEKDERESSIDSDKTKQP